MQYYNTTAKIYDRLYQEEQKRKYKVALRTIYNQNTTLDNRLVLDVGCGTGLLEDVDYFDGDLICIDLSKNMLKEAKHKFGNKLDLLCVDADYLPFREQIFDFVLSFTLLQNMPEPEKTIIEIRRIAKEGAMIVFSSIKKIFSKEFLLFLCTEKKISVINCIDDKELKDYVVVCKCF